MDGLRRPITRMMKPLVLQYGREADLLKTRGWVLESAGFEVRSAGDPGEVSRVLAAQPAAALILCHTLSLEERDSVLAAARSSAPGLRSVILTETDTGRTADGSSLLLWSLAGVKALLGAVQQAVQRA